MNQADIDRFWSKVVKVPDGCWLWTASKVRGYGQFRVTIARGKYRMLKAHRVAYELCKGPIPEGLPLDHLCRVPACVNPDHLEIVSARTNTLRGQSPSIVTHATGICKRGHLIAGANRRVTADGRVQCLECHKDMITRWRQAHPDKMRQYKRTYLARLKQETTRDRRHT